MRYWYLILSASASIIAAHNLNDIFDKGLHAFSQHDYQTASNYFQQADAIVPNKPEIMFNLACCYIELGNMDNAISLLRRIIKLKPDYTKAYKRLIELLKKRGATEEIEKLSAQLLLYTQDDVQAHLALARKYKSAEQFDASIAHYLKAIEAEAHNKNICFELAVVYTLIGQTKI